MTLTQQLEKFLDTIAFTEEKEDQIFKDVYHREPYSAFCGPNSYRNWVIKPLQNDDGSIGYLLDSPCPEWNEARYQDPGSFESEDEALACARRTIDKTLARFAMDEFLYQYTQFFQVPESEMQAAINQVVNAKTVTS